MEKSRWWGELRVQRLTVDPDFERAVCQHSGFRVGHRICNGDERAGGVGNPAQRNKHSNEAEDCASGWHSKFHVRHVSLPDGTESIPPVGQRRGNEGLWGKVSRWVRGR